ncbi:ATP-binding protein [Epilithonimonas hungarica]|nr:sensor histidine kinase [Epilithonimonas hungarica]
MFEKFSAVINKDSDSAYYYCKQAYKLNNKIGNDYYASRCLILYASYYYNLGNNSKCRKYIDQALILAKKTGNIIALYRIYNLKGIMFFEAGEYDKAFNEYQKALFYLKKKPDNKYYGILHYSFGNLFLIKGDTISGIKNYKLTSKYSILAKDTARILSSYILIANAIQSKDHQKANDYYEKAYRLAQLTKDRQEQFDIRFNQSNNFLDPNNQSRNEKALSYLKAAEKLLKQLDGKDLYNFYLYFNYGAYYMNKNDFQNAIKHYELAYKAYDAERIPIDQKLNILKSLVNVYKKDNNFQKSYEYQSLFYKLKDSLFTIEKEKNYNHLLAKYEVGKKNNQIQLLSKENELQKVRKTKLYFILGLLVILLLLGFFLYKNKLKSQQKLNKKQLELNKTRDILEGQNKERNRLAKELHDSVAGSLAGINFMLDKENDVLQNDNLSVIQRHINTLHEEIREITHDLSNHFLMEKTFYQLMQHLAKRNRENGILTDILFFPENALTRINEETKNHLYRIIQELFTNIRKHANATRVQMSVTQHENSICIMIEDNGQGFDKNKTGGIGLKNIKERLKIFKAHLEIDSFPNNGTTVTITFRI